jgi:hypothetical protein
MGCEAGAIEDWPGIEALDEATPDVRLAQHQLVEGVSRDDDRVIF